MNTHQNSDLTIPPVSVDCTWIYSRGYKHEHPQYAHTWNKSVFTHASLCLLSWWYLVILHTHALMTCSKRRSGSCWFSIGIPTCLFVCVSVTCVCSMYLNLSCACTYRLCQGAAGCSHCFNSSSSVMSTYITEVAFLHTRELQCLQLHQWAVSKFWVHRSKSVLIGCRRMSV